jgi:hypothetical protein
MADCINSFSWVSSEEIYAYMKGCVAGGEYEPEDWSVDGMGKIEKPRDLIIEHKE